MLSSSVYFKGVERLLVSKLKLFVVSDVIIAISWFLFYFLHRYLNNGFSLMVFSNTI